MKRARWREVLELPLAAAVAGYVLLSEVVGPLVAPLARALGRLRLLVRLREGIERLGPYTSLILLAVPVVLLEPLKLAALFWIGTGQVALGTAALIGAHGLSLLFIERLFLVVRPKLLTLPWLAAIWLRVTSVRDAVLRWLHSTWVWSRSAGLRRSVKASVARLRSRLVPTKP